MKVMERCTQTVEKDGWDVYWSKEKKWETLETRLGGFPTKRHYRPISNRQTTIVWERDWESFAAMETAYEKQGADPEAQELAKVPSMITSNYFELFIIVK